MVHDRDSRDCKCLSPATSTHKGLIVCKSGVNKVMHFSNRKPLTIQNVPNIATLRIAKITVTPNELAGSQMAKQITLQLNGNRPAILILRWRSLRRPMKGLPIACPIQKSDDNRGLRLRETYRDCKVGK